MDVFVKSKENDKINVEIEVNWYGKQFDRILEITVVAEPTETIETDESNNENDDSFDTDLESTEITNEE